VLFRSRAGRYGEKPNKSSKAKSPAAAFLLDEAEFSDVEMTKKSTSKRRAGRYGEKPNKSSKAKSPAAAVLLDEAEFLDVET
jgi:hypothetical protein